MPCCFLSKDLKINVQKRMLLGISIPKGGIKNMALVLGRRASTFPYTYLGVQVGCNMSCIANWKGVAEKCKN